MALARVLARSSRTFLVSSRPFSASAFRAGLNERANDNAEEHRKIQKERPLNPHITSTTSTIANEMPSLGKDKPPPEMISSVDPNYVPKDSVPENTERMTGGTQNPPSGKNAELEVGEIEGGTFKVEPMRRTGEDDSTMRASRKRGTLESDLLLSTFADENLGSMTRPQLQQYDLFLDENDWDIYYWATQETPSTSFVNAEGAGPEMAAPEAQGKAPQQQKEPDTDAWRQGKPRSGEWAQTVGTFKPAYRPVPARWKDSDVLKMLRKHVMDRSAGGVSEGEAKVDGSSLNHSVKGTGGGGLGFMPPLKNFNS
ncbi:hypothetical protein NA57DRAFT_42710 [Rhizodiscina lignyota]|uniref:Succinate dehydrogenase assembly factor 2, mitochondrial n=1 Tax=Rhizodiscina lignyota TaxID=1504668 RepID=A0A9P4ICB4_9PEZI|nr:hypothetical protein NA57DRAFT_42710 [Rhizodiscina lignyota]